MVSLGSGCLDVLDIKETERRQGGSFTSLDISAATDVTEFI